MIIIFLLCFFDDFENYDTGTPINGQNGWYLNSCYGANAVITDEISHSGEKCLKMMSNTDTINYITLYRYEDFDENFWLEFYIYFKSIKTYDFSMALNSENLLYLNNNMTRRIAVTNWDGAPRIIFRRPIADTGKWMRITIRINLEEQNFDVFINDTLYYDQIDLPTAYTDSSIESVEMISFCFYSLSRSPIYIDDILISEDTFPQNLIEKNILPMSNYILRFIQISDPHIHCRDLYGVTKEDIWYKFRRAILEAYLFSPNYIFITGDMVDSGLKEDYDTLEWLIETVYDTLKWYSVIGNHEFHGLSHDSALMLYTQYTGLPRYYYLEDTAFIFIGLATCDDDDQTGEVDSSQLHWLCSLLDAKKQKEAIILSHCPLEDIGTQELKDILIEKNVLLYLCGHWHWLADDSLPRIRKYGRLKEIIFPRRFGKRPLHCILIFDVYPDVIKLYKKNLFTKFEIDSISLSYFDTPYIYPEPSYSCDTVNTVYWKHFAKLFKVQCDTDSLFSTPISSEWLTDTFYTFTGLKDKKYFFRVKGKNSFGIETEWSNITGTMQITRLPLAPAIIMDTIFNENEIKITLHNEENLIKIDGYRLKISKKDTCIFDVYSSDSIFYFDLGDGEYTVYAYSRDIAGRYSLPSIKSFIIDTHSPASPVLLSPAFDKYLNSLSITFKWQSDDAFKFLFWIDSTVNWQGVVYRCTTKYESLKLKLNEGRYYWRVKAFDIAQNQSEWSSAFKLTIDTTPPVIKEITNEFEDGALKIRIKAKDNSKIDSVILYYKEENWNKIKIAEDDTVFNFLLPPPSCTLTCLVKIKDKAQNVSFSDTLKIKPAEIKDKKLNLRLKIKNPCDKIFIHLKTTSPQEINLKIFDASGRLIFARKYHIRGEKKITIDNLTEGAYFIRVNNFINKVVIIK